MLQVADMFMEAVDLPELHAVGEQVACGAEAEDRADSWRKVKPEILLFRSFPFISAVLGSRSRPGPKLGDRLGVWVRGAFLGFPDIELHCTSVAVLNWPGRPWGGVMGGTPVIVREF